MIEYIIRSWPTPNNTPVYSAGELPGGFYWTAFMQYATQFTTWQEANNNLKLRAGSTRTGLSIIRIKNDKKI